MKIAVLFLGFLALFGIAYGLAFFGIIPTQKMADKSPGLAQTLITLHLAKAKKLKAAGKTPSAPAVVSPEQEAFKAQKKQVADAKAALDKQQADFEAQKQAATSPAPGVSVSAAAAVPSSAVKLDAIYAAMSSDDLLTIFAKLPDPDIIRALMNMDEKKAGKVLAGLPSVRAAHLTQQMSHPRPVASL